MGENEYLGVIKLSGETDMMYVKIIAESLEVAEAKLYLYLEGREISSEEYEVISGDEIDIIL
jgi:hypothetical protein